jgi:hypothetical protein
MKKLIALLAVLAIAAPAMAQDWKFYGSARMATFWQHTDFGKTWTNSEYKDDDDLLWDLQGNTRLGANVKADKVSGRIELALPSTNTHDGNVGVRLAYGTWKFSDAASLTVGKAYTPTSQFISAQTFYEDLGLLGFGTNYARRPGKIQLDVAGFSLALIQPNSQAWAGGDTDEWLPKIEAAYGMKLGMFSFNVMGGFQTYKVEDLNTAGGVNDDFDVNSWIVGGDLGFNVGAVYVKGAGSYGQNWTNARWSDLGIGYANAAGAASLKGSGTDTEDATSWQAALVAGFKLTDALAFEVGGGYRVNDSNISGTKKDDVWALYGNATVALAKGVYLVPEVGYVDFMKNSADVDEGYTWYAGMKWQIDF